MVQVYIEGLYANDPDPEQTRWKQYEDLQQAANAALETWQREVAEEGRYVEILSVNVDITQKALIVAYRELVP